MSYLAYAISTPVVILTSSRDSVLRMGVTNDQQDSVDSSVNKVPERPVDAVNLVQLPFGGVFLRSIGG